MSEDGRAFRYALGFVVILGGLSALAGLYVFDVPTGNREALLLAVGLVLGWGGSVVSYEFGSSPAGRKAADAGLQRAAEQPSGRLGDPVHSIEEHRR